MQIIRGKVPGPHRSVLYAVPGIGKTHFACGIDYPSSAAAPNVLVMDLEDGTNEMDVARVKGASNWADSLKLIDEMCSAKGDWKTIVIDTIDRLEDQAATALCIEGNGKAKNLRSLKDFGWNDGFHHLAARWREMLFRLEAARAHGRSVWLVAHITRNKINDPTLGEFHEWAPSIHPLCWGATHRWSDNVFYAAYEQGLVDGRSIITGARRLHTVAGSGFQAKNRYNLPAVMPLSYAEFERERARGTRAADEVRASILELLKGQSDDLSAKVTAAARENGDDVRRLCATERALVKKLSEVKNNGTT